MAVKCFLLISKKATNSGRFRTKIVIQVTKRYPDKSMAAVSRQWGNSSMESLAMRSRLVSSISFGDIIL